jgi:hypothetical protein
VEAVGTAQLTDRIPAERAVAASVSRREIRDVLQEADAAPELTLDVVAGDGSREHGTISITWSREDLEKLLEDATGNDVVLTFDRNQLTAALDDVEAHGLRTRAAVFAVAAVGALGSGASIANASIAGGDGGGTAPVAVTTQSGDAASAALQARSEAMNVQFGLGDSASDAIVTDASTGGYATPSQSGDAAQAGLQARSEAMNAQYGLGTSASDAIVTDASTGGYAAPSQSGDEAALQARSEALNQEYGLTPGGQNDPAVQALEARGAAMNAQYGLGGSASDSTVTDASTGGGYAATPTASGGGGFELQRPSTDEALLAGAALLTIAGAAFAARRGSVPRPA